MFGWFKARAIEQTLDWLLQVQAERHAALLANFKRLERVLMEKLDALAAEVAETNTVMGSAVTLINGLSQQLKEAGTDPEKLEELRAALDAQSTALAAAVAANTPAAPPSE